MNIAVKYRWIAAAVGLLAVVFLMWYFSTIVFYILTAAVFAIMGKPLVRVVGMIRIGHWRPARWLSALVALLMLMVIVGAVCGTLIPVVVSKLQLLGSYDISDVESILREPIAAVENYVNSTFPNANFSVKQAITERVTPLLASGMIQNTVGSIANMLMDVAMAVFSICFITYFFLKDERLFGEGVVVLFPKQYEENITRALSSSTSLLIRYFVGICIESLIKLILVSVPLYFIGFEFSTALMIGLISAVLNVIPYVGPIIGALIGFAIAAISPIYGVTLGSVLMQMSIVFLIFQLLDNVILQPYIYASSVRAHPLEIFLVILMAGYLAGIMGMLFAIPAYTVLRVFAKEFFSNLRVVQRLTDNI